MFYRSPESVKFCYNIMFIMSENTSPYLLFNNIIGGIVIKHLRITKLYAVTSQIKYSFCGKTPNMWHFQVGKGVIMWKYYPDSDICQTATIFST